MKYILIILLYISLMVGCAGMKPAEEVTEITEQRIITIVNDLDYKLTGYINHLFCTVEQDGRKIPIFSCPVLGGEMVPGKEYTVDVTDWVDHRFPAKGYENFDIYEVKFSDPCSYCERPELNVSLIFFPLDVSDHIIVYASELVPEPEPEPEWPGERLES